MAVALQVTALFSKVISHGHRLGITCLDLRGNLLGRAAGEGLCVVFSF
jgi:hypothetical protein